MSAHHDLILNVAGPLRLTEIGGQDRTPRLRRAQAILAMLSVAPDLRRSRAWLQDHLWSEQTSTKGGAAQRYALWELRRDLGPNRDALLNGPGWIGLDSARVKVHLPGADETGQGGADFAEGLDVPDPEFEIWLRNTRQGFCKDTDEMVAAPGVDLGWRDAAAAPPRAVLEVRSVETVEAGLRLPGNSLLTSIASRVARNCGAAVRVRMPDTVEPLATGRHICLQLHLARVRDGVFMQINAIDRRRDDLVWSAERLFERPAAMADPSDPLANIAARQISLAFATPPSGATEAELVSAAWCCALTEPEHLRLSALMHKETELRAIPFRNLRGLVAARRALLLAWAVIEHGATCDPALLEQAQMLASQAVEWDPANPEVLAVASEIVDFRRDPDLAMDFAQRAVALDPRHPLSNASMAKALARSGQSHNAYRYARAAQRLATGSANAGWWSMLTCVAAVSCGDTSAALRHARIASSLDPDFRPPLRFLGVLSFASGDRVGAAAAFNRLKALESDFTPEVLIDPDYPLRSFPIGMLREIAQAGLIR